MSMYARASFFQNPKGEIPERSNTRRYASFNQLAPYLPSFHTMIEIMFLNFILVALNRKEL
jgi:hypothetical protein